jgi:hypothetical protein
MGFSMFVDLHPVFRRKDKTFTGDCGFVLPVFEDTLGTDNVIRLQITLVVDTRNAFSCQSEIVGCYCSADYRRIDSVSPFILSPFVLEKIVLARVKILLRLGDLKPRRRKFASRGVFTPYADFH